MFKMLVLQQLYNISDEELEYQVNDRLSFMRFLGLTLADDVPDSTTVWLFRHQLKLHGIVEQLFEQFDHYLNQEGYQARGGQILDATLVPVPKQHNSKEEKEQLAQGQIPESWREKPHRLCQKDIDARWTKKNAQSHFGYKNHVNIDVEYGFVRDYEVTDAAVHDSQMLGVMGFISCIHERAYRNRPLSQAQKESNRERSKVRAKVEHVFGTWVNSMGGKLMRCIGEKSIKANIGMKNLVYNFKRYVFWEGKKEPRGQCV